MPCAFLSRTSRLLVSARVLASLKLVLLSGLMVGLAVSASQAASPAIQGAIHPNVRSVQEFHRHLATGNAEGLRALTVPDVEWTLPGQHIQAGTRKGLGEILPLLWQLKRAGIGTEVLHLGGNEHQVVDLRQGQVERGGMRQDFFWVRVYEMRDGKIMRVHDFPSDQQAADVFFWKAFPSKPEEDLIRD